MRFGRNKETCMIRKSRSEECRRALERDFLASYEEYADALFRHCLIRVRDRELAKDIVQESFGRTWKYLADGKQVEYFRAFLFRVAGNLIVDVARKKKAVSLERMMEEDGFEVADEAVVDPTIRTATREALGYLKSLDEIYRTAIHMRYFDNKSPKQIAAELGVSENVISVRIHRGIERLGRLMKRQPAKA